MPDEYYQHYRRYSHDELYRQLHQGSPPTLTRQADAWRRTGETVAALAAVLSRDLDRLGTRWTGRGSEEFQSRIALIATYAQDLANEAASISTGTTVMAQALAEAQRQAEPGPAAPVPAVFAAASPGAALLSAAASQPTLDAVLGPALGHITAPAQQTAAYERMVALVSQLAAQYGVADQANWPVTIPDAPAGMPGAVPAGAGPTSGLAGMGTGSLAMHGSAGSHAPGGTGVSVAVGRAAVPGPIGPAGTVPAAALTGAGPGLAGAPKAPVNVTPVAAPAPDRAAATSAAGVMPLTAGSAVIGQQTAGYAAGHGADWWSGRGTSWLAEDDAGTEPPAPVLDGSS